LLSNLIWVNKAMFTIKKKKIKVSVKNESKVKVKLRHFMTDSFIDT